MADDQWFAPDHKPPAPQPPKPGEPLWEYRSADHHTWSAERHFRGESYGCEAQILRDAQLVIGHRWIIREQAARWADEMRVTIERGFDDEPLFWPLAPKGGTR